MAKKVEAARNWAAEVEWEVRELTQQQEKIKADMEDIQESHEAFIAQNTQDIKEAQDAIATLTGEQREKMAAILDNLGDIGRKQKDLYEATAQRMEEIMGTVTETINQSLKAFAPVVRAINETADKLRESAEIWALLGPYMKKETEEHPEIYGDDEHPDIGEDVPLEALIAAAAERARADGVDVPRLQAEDEMQRRQRISETKAKRAEAKSNGALMEFTRLSTLADSDLGFGIFTAAVLTILPFDAKDLMIDPETGAIDLFDLSQRGGELKDVKRVDSAFLLWLFSIAYYNADLRENNSNNAIVEFNIPDTLKKMGVDPRKVKWEMIEEGGKKKKIVRREALTDPARQRFEAFMEYVRPLLNIAAWFGKDDNKKLLPIVNFEGYDPNSESIKLSIPYMFALVEYEKIHSKPYAAIVSVFHTDIVHENQTAVEVANRIAMGLIKRGVTTPQEKTYLTPDKRKPSKETFIKEDKDGTKSKIIKEYKEEPNQLIVVSEPIAEPIAECEAKKPIYWGEQFRNIIAQCPQFKSELEEIRTAKGPKELAVIEAAKKTGTKPDAQTLAAARKADHKNDPQKYNNKIKDVFDGAIRIILNKSDMPNFYAEFELGRGTTQTPKHLQPYRAPTKTQLTDYLVIRHKGKNPKYVKPT